MPFDPSPPENPNRRIYRYQDGSREVAADPAVLWRRLNAACVARSTTWAKLVEQWASLAPKDEDDPAVVAEKMVAFNDLQGVISDATREAFSLAPLDIEGAGVTEGEVVAVLSDFIAEREKKGPSTASSPSSSGPTDGGTAG